MWEAANILAALVEVGSLNDIVGDENQVEFIQLIVDPDPYTQTP